MISRTLFFSAALMAILTAPTMGAQLQDNSIETTHDVFAQIAQPAKAGGGKAPTSGQKPAAKKAGGAVAGAKNPQNKKAGGAAVAAKKTGVTGGQQNGGGQNTAAGPKKAAKAGAKR